MPKAMILTLALVCVGLVVTSVLILTTRLGTNRAAAVWVSFSIVCLLAIGSAVFMSRRLAPSSLPANTPLVSTTTAPPVRVRPILKKKRNPPCETTPQEAALTLLPTRSFPPRLLPQLHTPSTSSSPAANTRNSSSSPTPPSSPRAPPRPPRVRRWDPTPEGEFTVLSYNIRCDVDGPPHTWMEREVHVATVLREHTPSVVCLQESTPDTAAALARGGGLRVLGAVRCRTGRPEGAHILFDPKRWRVVKSSTRILTEGGPVRCGAQWCTAKTVFGGEKAKHPRLFTHAQLRQRGASGETLHVLNTHFPLSETLQRASAAQLARFVQKLKGRVVLCGDLNSHYSPKASGTPLQILLRDGNLTDTLGLRDVSTFGPYGSVSATTHRLDYVLYRGMQPPVKAGVSDHRYGPNQFRPSDHSAIHATFTT